MFRTVPLSIIRSFLLYTHQWYMSYSLRAGSGRNVLILLASCQQTCMTYTIAVYSETSWSYSQAVSKPVWHIPLLCTVKRTDPTRKMSANLYDIYHCCVQWKTPDDGQRNSPFRPDDARKLYDIYHCCTYSEKFLMMDRKTVRNM